MKTLLRTKTLLALATMVFIFVLHVLPSAFAQNLDFKYVGPTGDFMGDMGVLAGHNACRGLYGKKSVMCSSRMIIENGADPKGGFIPVDGAWVNPHPTGFFILENGSLKAHDFSERVGHPENTNCIGWQVGLNSVSTGYTIERAKIADPPHIGARACNTSRPVACCGGNAKKFELTGPLP